MGLIDLKTRLYGLAPHGVRELWKRLTASSIRSRLFHGTFWVLLGTLAARALGLAAAIVVARNLGRVQYGALGIIQTTVGMFGMLAGFGMGTTAAKYVAELRGKDPGRAGTVIALSNLVSWVVGGCLSIALLGFAPWLCRSMLASPFLTPYLQLSAPLLVLGGVNGAQIGVLLGFEAFKTQAQVAFMAGLINFTLLVIGASRYGLPGVIVGMVVAQAFICFLYSRALRQEARQYGIPISYSIRRADLPIIWKFSVPTVLTVLLISAANWAASAMLVRRPGGIGELGAFNAANQWYGAMQTLPQMMGTVALPIFAERLAAEDLTTSIKLFNISLKVNALVAIPLVVLGSLASPYIMMSYGASFREAWPTLIVILLTAAMVSLDSPAGQVITASGRMWLGFLCQAAWAIVFLGLTPMLLHRGAFGLASARLIANFMHLIWIVAFALYFLRQPKRPYPVQDHSAGQTSSG